MSRPAASAETVPQEPPKTAVIYRARLGRRKAKVRWADDRSGLRGVLLAALSPLPRKSKRPVWMRNTTPPEDLTPESAQLILDEAENLYTSRRDQALRAESRATTLQASAGVAIGLVFTGGAFLLDPTKVADRPWRIVLTVVLALLLFCLGMAAYLANRATTKILIFAQPQPSGLVKRASMTTTDARWDRAMLLLHSADKNSYFTNFKILQVKVAGLWFRAALACFGALSVLLLIYAAAGPIPS
jgi:hypothetical protein